MTCASSERPGEYLRGQCTLECTSRPAGGIRRNIIYFIALFVLTSPPPPPPPPRRSRTVVSFSRCDEARFDRVACNPCFFHTALSLSPPLSSLYSCRAYIHIHIRCMEFSSSPCVREKKKRKKNCVLDFDTRRKVSSACY